MTTELEDRLALVERALAVGVNINLADFAPAPQQAEAPAQQAAQGQATGPGSELLALPIEAGNWSTLNDYLATLGAGAAGLPYAPKQAGSILKQARTLFGGTNNANSTLVSGHGWTTSGGDATTNLNYSGDPAPPNGSQCIRLVSAGAGAAAVTTCPRIGTPVNMTGKCLVLQLKVDAANATHLVSLSIYAGGGASALTNFSSQSIVQYDGSTGDYGEMCQPGEWFTVSLPVMSFRGATGGTPDWTTIQDVRVRIQDDATGNKTTVYVGGAWFAQQDNVRYAPNGGVVSISFDDLWASQYTAAMPKMAQYGYRGTIFAIHDTLDNTGLGYLTSAQLAALRVLGWEVQPHAYSLARHNRADGFAGLLGSEIASDWSQLRAWLVSLGYVDMPIWAAPQGKQDATVEAQARETWAGVRTICNRAMESVPPADPFRIKCQSNGNTTVVSPAGTVGSILWLIDQAYAYGGWLNLCFHKVQSSAATSLEFTIANFGTVIDYLNTKGIAVATINEVLAL